MSSLTILPRSDWSARPHKSSIRSRDPSSISELYLHWPGSDPKSWANVDTKAEEAKVLRTFQNYHMDAPDHLWSDIGYNHVMGGRGSVPRIWTARGAQYIPAAQLGHNEHTIACCILVGPDDTISGALRNRIRSYIRWAEGYAGHRLLVRGHYAAPGQSTECPGPKLKALITEGAFNIHR